METEAPPNRPAPRWTIALLLVLALAAAVAIAWQRKTTKTLAAENQQVTLALQQTQAQLDALKSKIDSMTQQGTPVIAPVKPAAAISSRKPHVVHTATHRRHADDPRWKQFQSRLDEQGKQIDATRQDLASARTELNGSIARTHDELVSLERKGERSYFEFDINKSKQFRATGPVGIRLKKANTKHSYADLELMVDDADLSKKHVNLYEPVTFYASDEGRPVELVINSLSKDHIHGYVATPKYSKTELAAMSSNHEPGDATEGAAPTRRKLELPKN
ncbi:MAG: hypothetical protein ACXVZX_02100 [Terriglobales bacterium]